MRTHKKWIPLHQLLISVKFTARNIQAVKWYNSQFTHHVLFYNQMSLFSHHSEETLQRNFKGINHQVKKTYEIPVRTCIHWSKLLAHHLFQHLISHNTYIFHQDKLWSNHIFCSESPPLKHDIYNLVTNKAKDKDVFCTVMHQQCCIHHLY